MDDSVDDGLGAAGRAPYDRRCVDRALHVVDGVLSPSGDCAVVACAGVVAGQSGTACDDAVARTSLWRVDLHDGTFRRITSERADASNPRFSADGRLLYFLSARDPAAKDPQVHAMSMEGGEADPVTHIAGGVRSFEVSPDGTRFLAASTGSARVERGERDHVRITRAAYRFDAQPGWLQDAPQSLFVGNLASGVAMPWTEPDGMIVSAAWSPDGRRIAFVRLMGRDNDAFLFGDLCVAEDGPNGVPDVRTLVAHVHLQLPFWSADGTRVGYCAPPDSDVARQSQLYVVALDGSVPESRTARSDRLVPARMQIDSPAVRCVHCVRAIDDAVIVQQGDGGEARLVRVALSGPERCEPIVAGPRICTLLDLRDGRVLLTSQDATTPARLCIADADGTGERVVADFNAAWHRDVAWPRVEHFDTTTRDGTRIEAWALLPSHRPAPHPAILYIHGGPHAAWGWGFGEDLHELVGAGYAVLCANSRGSAGYGDAFTTAICGRWGEPEQEDFDTVLDAAIARGWIAADRIGVMGVSGGGHLSAWLITHSDRFRAAIPEQGVYEMLSMYGVSDAGPPLVVREMGGLPHEVPQTYWRLSPMAHAHRCTTPTLLIQGEDDVRCPMSQAEAFFTALKAAGCAVELLRLAKCNHGLQMVGPLHLRRARMDAILDWWERHLDRPSRATDIVITNN